MSSICDRHVLWVDLLRKTFDKGHACALVFVASSAYVCMQGASRGHRGVSMCACSLLCICIIDRMGDKIR